MEDNAHKVIKGALAEWDTQVGDVMCLISKAASCLFPGQGEASMVGSQRRPTIGAWNKGSLNSFCLKRGSRGRGGEILEGALEDLLEGTEALRPFRSSFLKKIEEKQVSVP